MESGISVFHANKKISTLSIDSVQEEHAGSYTCIARNRAGITTVSAWLHVNSTCYLKILVSLPPIPLSRSPYRRSLLFVLVAPTILPFEFGNEKFNSGDTISIACSVIKGDLPVNITWLLNNKTVENYDGIVVNQVNKKLSTLSIEYVTADHVGKYTCKTSNRAGVDSYSAHLRVNGILFCCVSFSLVTACLIVLPFIPFTVLPYIIPFEFEGDANTGDSVQLNCYVSKGDTPLTITWTLNGENIKPDIGISAVLIGQRTNLLTINSVEAEHAGEYTCLALNKAGRTLHSATLNVNGIFIIGI